MGKKLTQEEEERLKKIVEKTLNEMNDNWDSKRSGLKPSCRGLVKPSWNNLEICCGKNKQKEIMGITPMRLTTTEKISEKIDSGETYIIYKQSFFINKLIDEVYFLDKDGRILSCVTCSSIERKLLSDPKKFRISFPKFRQYGYPPYEENDCEGETVKETIKFELGRLKELVNFALRLQAEQTWVEKIEDDSSSRVISRLEKGYKEKSKLSLYVFGGK